MTNTASLSAPPSTFKLYGWGCVNLSHIPTAFAALWAFNRVKGHVHFYGAVARHTGKIVIRHAVAP
jgi:hypothetical protein